MYHLVGSLQAWHGGVSSASRVQKCQSWLQPEGRVQDESVSPPRLIPA